MEGKREAHPMEGKEEETPIRSLEKLRSVWEADKAPDWPIVELLGRMCEKAYLSPEEAKKAYLGLGFTQVQPVAAGSMVGYVVSAEEITVVVFRGTDDQADWLVNLDCRTAPTPHGSIHKGFYDAYYAPANPQQPLRSQILVRLKENLPKHLWITGHSLGGALALVCMYDLVENEKLQVNGLLTFGQPMVVQPELGEYLDQLLMHRYTYFVNGKDIVPRVPPSYIHCGARIWFLDGQIEQFIPQRSICRITPLKGLTPEEALVPVPSKKLEPVPSHPNSQPKALVPLSPEEFEQLKASLRNDKSIARGTSIRGNLPWLRDHAMDRYLQKIRNFLQNKPGRNP